jgi:hypothetical protein
MTVTVWMGRKRQSFCFEIFLFDHSEIRRLEQEGKRNNGYEAAFSKMQGDSTERSGLQEGVYQSVERLENQPS